MISRDLSEEKNENGSVNTHKDNENEEEKKKGKKRLAHVYHTTVYVI